MNKFKWLSHDAIEIMHEEQLLARGCLPNIKNVDAQESALTRLLIKAADREALLQGLLRPAEIAPCPSKSA